MRVLKKSAVIPKIKELKASKKLILFFDNLAVIKSTITLPFFKWQRGKNEPIATAHAISTNSKSPKRGDEKTTRPKIERILINAAIKRTKPPKRAKNFDILVKIRPNSLSGRIFFF